MSWHSTCYSSYTSGTEYTIPYRHPQSKRESPATNEETRRVSRSSASASIDWSKCFICRKKTPKKCREMHNVCTFEACESVREAAGSQGHEGMLHVLMSVTNNLTAAEAKYHKTCFASYVIKSNLKHEKRKQKQFMTRYSKRWRPKLVKVYIYTRKGIRRVTTFVEISRAPEGQGNQGRKLQKTALETST